MTGPELKERREALGLTQEALARELGLVVSTISRWERGDRGMPGKLMDICLDHLDLQRSIGMFPIASPVA